MEAFDRVLQRAEAGLRVPEPRRSRILLEMASDLEDLYREYRERGLAEGEARERAVRLLGASPDVLEELQRAHGSRLAGLLDRLSGHRAPRVERWILLITAALTMAGGARMAFAALAPTAWTWAVLALAGAGAWVAAARALALYVWPERLGAHPTDDLRALGGLALACLAAGALGALVTLTSPPGVGSAWTWPPPAVLWHRIGYAAALASLGLTAALALAGAWLLLRWRSRVVEDARRALRAALGRTSNPTPTAHAVHHDSRTERVP